MSEVESRIKEIAINNEIEIETFYGKWQTFDGYHYTEFYSESDLLEFLEKLNGGNYVS